MISFIASSKRFADFPKSEKEIVFIGKSNVGKSSLINVLYKKGLAYVGKTPGKTKLLNFFNIHDEYTICDVPGYGYAKRSDKEIVEFGKMMDDYFTKRKCIRCCVLILDIRRIPNDDDLDMIAYLNVHNIPYIIVLNKMDKYSNNEIFNAKRQIKAVLGCNEEDMISISCEKRKNIEAVQLKIAEYLQ